MSCSTHWGNSKQPDPLERANTRIRSTRKRGTMAGASLSFACCAAMFFSMKNTMLMLRNPWKHYCCPELFSPSPHTFFGQIQNSVASRLLEKSPSGRVIMVIDVNSALYGCCVRIFSGLQVRKPTYPYLLPRAVLLI